MAIAPINHIDVDEKGIARIAGTRFKIIHLVMDQMANNSTSQDMAREFDLLSLAQIHAALSYYFDHKVAIDAQIAESIAFSDNFFRNSRFQFNREELLERKRKLDGELRRGNGYNLPLDAAFEFIEGY